jgi:hypothetical protein
MKYWQEINKLQKLSKVARINAARRGDTEREVRKLSSARCPAHAHSNYFVTCMTSGLIKKPPFCPLSLPTTKQTSTGITRSS